jgi:uncharacterized protein
MRKLVARVEPAAQAAAKQLGLDSAELEPLKGAVPVVQVTFVSHARNEKHKSRRSGDTVDNSPSADRLPIYVTDAGSQILCISYLFQERDIKAKSRTTLLETLLDLNPSVPLSDFGRIGEHYVLIGALSPASSVDDLALELATLSDNATDALATLKDFLKLTSGKDS